jgi:hypothetical protein
MPGNEDFCAYPDNFLMEELVITPPNEGTPAGIYYFSVAKSSNWDPKNDLTDLKTKTGKQVWNLMLHRGKIAGNPTIEAYWCPYVQDGTGTITLGKQATYMFTAGLTGCSFGFGTPGGDGELRIAHANVMVQGAGDSVSTQATGQAGQLQTAGTDRKFEPGAYRTKGVGQATIFGIRGIVHWRIFAHRFKTTPDGLNMEDLGVERIC